MNIFCELYFWKKCNIQNEYITFCKSIEKNIFIFVALIFPSWIYTHNHKDTSNSSSGLFTGNKKKYCAILIDVTTTFWLYFWRVCYLFHLVMYSFIWVKATCIFFSWSFLSYFFLSLFLFIDVLTLNLLSPTKLWATLKT